MATKQHPSDREIAINIARETLRIGMGANRIQRMICTEFLLEVAAREKLETVVQLTKDYLIAPSGPEAAAVYATLRESLMDGGGKS